MTKTELKKMSKADIINALKAVGATPEFIAQAEKTKKDILIDYLYDRINASTSQTTKKEEKNMKKETTTNTTAVTEKTTDRKDNRPAITTLDNAHLQPNSLDIEAEVFDKFAPLLTDDLKIRRWACNKNLYTFYLGRGQVAEITFRRKDFRVACRPAYAPESYQARKSGYGLDAYTDEAELTGAVAEVSTLLDHYRQIEADKKAAKEKAAAEKKAAAAKKAEEKAKKEAAKKAEKEKKAVSKKEKKVAEKVAK